jgi:hypothetical protein
MDPQSPKAINVRFSYELSLDIKYEGALVGLDDGVGLVAAEGDSVITTDGASVGAAVLFDNEGTEVLGDDGLSEGTPVGIALLTNNDGTTVDL